MALPRCSMYSPTSCQTPTIIDSLGCSAQAKAHILLRTGIHMQCVKDYAPGCGAVLHADMQAHAIRTPKSDE